MKKTTLHVQNRVERVKEMFTDRKHLVLVLFVLLSDIILRFTYVGEHLAFGWDQIQNSWVMKTLFVDGRIPMIGMVAKGNSGFYIGPLYYYLLAPFYWIFRLDPMAGGYFVGVVSVITLVVLYFVTRSLFGKEPAVFTIFLYTVTSRVIHFDRLPWPVNFLPLISLLVFYSLYMVLMGRKKYFFVLASSIGFAFHFHFTAIFFPIIVLLCVPLMIYRKVDVRYALLSIPFFIIWFIPNFIADVTAQSSSGSHLTQYASIYFHGFHLRRVLQLLGDSVIEFEGVFTIRSLIFLKYLILPLFFWAIFAKLPRKKFITITSMIILWFLIPLLVFSTYSGELSDYYYTITRPFVYISIGYLLWVLWKKQNIIMNMIILVLFCVYSYVNITIFFQSEASKFIDSKEKAHNLVGTDKIVNFVEGDPTPYLYGMYMYQKKGIWP